MANLQMKIEDKVKIVESCTSLYLWLQSIEQQIYIFHDKDKDASILCYNGNICYTDARGMLNISADSCNTIPIINGLRNRAKIVPVHIGDSVITDFEWK